MWSTCTARCHLGDSIPFGYPNLYIHYKYLYYKTNNVAAEWCVTSRKQQRLLHNHITGCKTYLHLGLLHNHIRGCKTTYLHLGQGLLYVISQRLLATVFARCSASSISERKPVSLRSSIFKQGDSLKVINSLDLKLVSARFKTIVALNTLVLR